MSGPLAIRPECRGDISTRAVGQRAHGRASSAAPSSPTARFIARQQLIATPIAASAAARWLCDSAQAPLPVSEAQAIKVAEATDSLASPPFGSELARFWLPGSPLFQKQPAWIIAWRQTTQPAGAGSLASCEPPALDLNMNAAVSAVTPKTLAEFPSDEDPRIRRGTAQPPRDAQRCTPSRATRQGENRPRRVILASACLCPAAHFSGSAPQRGGDEDQCLR